MIAIDEMTIILGGKLSNDHNDCHRHQDKVSSEMTAKKTRVCFVYKTTYCLFPHFCFHHPDCSSWLVVLSHKTITLICQQQFQWTTSNLMENIWLKRHPQVPIQSLRLYWLLPLWTPIWGVLRLSAVMRVDYTQI